MLRKQTHDPIIQTGTTRSPPLWVELRLWLVVCVPLVGLIVLRSHDTDLGILAAHAVRSLGLATPVALDPFHSLGMKPEVLLFLPRWRDLSHIWVRRTEEDKYYGNGQRGRGAEPDLLWFTPSTLVPRTIESQRIWMMDRNHWSHSCRCRRFWVMLRMASTADQVSTADQAAAAIWTSNHPECGRCRIWFDLHDERCRATASRWTVAMRNYKWSPTTIQ